MRALALISSKDMKTLCFTGHRPQKLPFGFNENDPRCIRLKAVLTEQIEKAINERGVQHFICGMALGVDMISAELVLNLKEKYPFITLECAIPCRYQSRKWPEDQRKRYYQIVRKSDLITIIRDTYTPECMFERNKYMVDKSDIIIGVCAGHSGRNSGTSQTLYLAKQKKIVIILVNPIDLLVKEF